MTEITEVTIPRDLSAVYCSLEVIETSLCNYLSGDYDEDLYETITALMDSAVHHLRQLKFDLRSAGMAGSLAYDDLPVVDEDVQEFEDDPLSLQIEKVLNTMQPLLRLIGELNDEVPDPASLNSRLLAIDHLAMMTAARAEKCRQIAATA
jgi:hypothetical protein